MTDTKIAEPAAPVTDATAEEVKLPIGALYRKKSAFSRKLKFFQRDMNRYRELLQKIKDDKNSEDAKKFTDVILGYRMLRALCISNNWIVCKKEDDKRFIPLKFEAKLKTILGDGCLAGISAALKMTNAEVGDHIHKNVESKSVEGLLKFIEEHEKVSISDVLEKAIEEMNTELEARKDEPRPVRNKKRSTQTSPRDRVSSKKSQMTTEEKFRDLMKEVKGRIGAIKF